EEVHVWRVAIDRSADEVRELARLLDRDERARASRFHAARDLGRYVAGRGALRVILARYLAEHPSRLPLRVGPFGKPVLEGAEGPEALQFNLSHSDGLAVIAVAYGRRVGIDLERVRPLGDLDRIVDRFFSPAERAVHRSLPADRKLEAFFVSWTR